jgi:threonylcarbamoyladenosine tRNA methylthiotransferase MtaB
MTEAPDVVSFGCRLNLVEGEAIRRTAQAAGLSDLIIVNTCGVTAEATRQARQTIRRLKRETPERAVFATGCGVAIEQARFAAMPELAGLIDNAVKARPEAWRLAAGEADDARATPPASPLLEGREDHTRAFLAVQNGCDHSCTFCAIPQGRGRARSAPLAEVVAAARRLVEAGFREIVLTGVDLTSWGEDLPEQPKLGSLVRHLLAMIPDLPRLRLSSIDCIEADTDLIAAFAEEERLMPYLHLSLQSGDDLILKRMKRRHNARHAIDLCSTLRAVRPDISFGADLIAGFPTETEPMAERTRDLVEACDLAFLHIFPFSPRPGTPAARMPPVAPAIVKERARRLRELGDRALRRHLRSQVGRRLSVLAERGGLGRAPDFTPVATGTQIPGSERLLTILGHDGRKLYGRYENGA